MVASTACGGYRREWEALAVVPTLPFHLRFGLTRRHRLAAELLPWLPAIAGTTGFCIGVAYLVLSVSAWFLFLLLLPVIAYRGLFVFLFDIVFRAHLPVEVVVEDARFGVAIGSEQRWRTLDGIFQVCRSESGTMWTVLHLDGTVLMIPADAITIEQLDYLKSFALRAAAERRAAATSH
jgi:hypothetical protein